MTRLCFFRPSRWVARLLPLLLLLSPPTTTTTTTNIVVHAFSSYMTTTSGCLIDLDTTEVVMNSLIQAAPSWQALDRNRMQLVATLLQDAAAEPLAPTQVVTADRAVLEVPTNVNTIWFQVQGTVPDAQYVMQTAGGGAKFAHGLCDNETRVAGRVKDERVALLLPTSTSTAADAATTTQEEEDVHVWAGWAAGHEAVQLLPGFIVRRTAKKPASSSWTAAMATQVACTTVQLAESPVVVLERTVQASHDVTLQLSDEQEEGEEHVEGTFAIELQTNDRNNLILQSVAVQVTAGARFISTFHAAHIACQGDRVLWETVPAAQTLVVGTLQVDDNHDQAADEEHVHVQVRALYSVADDKDNVLYLTPPLNIRHGSHKEDHDHHHDQQQQEEEDQQGTVKRRMDPQKELEQDLTHRKQVSDLHAQIKNHEQKLSQEAGHERRGGGDTQQKQIIHHGHNGLLDEEEKEEEEAQMGGRKRTGDRPGGHLAAPEHHHHYNAYETDPEEEARRSARHDRHGLHDKIAHKIKQLKTDLADSGADKVMDVQNHHAFAKVHHFEGTPMSGKEFPTVAFDGAYLSGLVFLVTSTVATIQICRCASTRGSKGRFDL